RAMKRRYAFITARAQGLGQAMTHHLAAQHYTLFVHYYTSQPDAEALRADLAAAGCAVICLQADLAPRADRERLVRQVAAQTSELHGLVNNLGWYLMERLPAITIEQWEQALTRNGTATFHLTQLALPLLEAAPPPGRIMNLGDSACDRIAAHVMATPVPPCQTGRARVDAQLRPATLAQRHHRAYDLPGFPRKQRRASAAAPPRRPARALCGYPASARLSPL